MVTKPTGLAEFPGRYFAAWNQRELAIALAVISETVDWQDPSLPVPITDHDGAAGFFTAAWTGFPDMAFHALGEPLVDAANNRVTQEWRMTGTHTGEGFPPGVPPTGRAFDVTGMDVWEVDHTGKAVSVHAYWNVLALLTQLGLA